jgi:hypothetical protein
MKKTEVDRFPTTSEFYLTIAKGNTLCDGCVFRIEVRPFCRVLKDDAFDCDQEDGGPNNYIYKRKQRLV